MILVNQIGKPLKLIIYQSQNNQSNRLLLLLITHWGSMVPWFHPIFGKVEPWNMEQSIKISRINQDGLWFGELKDGLQGNFKRTSLGRDDLEKYIFIHRKRSHAQSLS